MDRLESPGRSTTPTGGSLAGGVSIAGGISVSVEDVSAVGEAGSISLVGDKAGDEALLHATNKITTRPVNITSLFALKKL